VTVAKHASFGAIASMRARNASVSARLVTSRARRREAISSSDAKTRLAGSIIDAWSVR
jgi:hypothetical protein